MSSTIAATAGQLIGFCFGETPVVGAGTRLTLANYYEKKIHDNLAALQSGNIQVGSIGALDLITLFNKEERDDCATIIPVIATAYQAIVGGKNSAQLQTALAAYAESKGKQLKEIIKEVINSEATEPGSVNEFCNAFVNGFEGNGLNYAIVTAKLMLKLLAEKNVTEQPTVVNV